MSDRPTARGVARAFVNGFWGMVEKVPAWRGEPLVDRLTAAIERDRAASDAELARAVAHIGKLETDNLRDLAKLDDALAANRQFVTENVRLLQRLAAHPKGSETT